MPLISEILIWIIALASILFVLLRPRGIAEAWWACGGAVILIITALTPLSIAVSAVVRGLDVFLFLAGMMILSQLAREEGVFDWTADIAAKLAQGSPRRLFLLVYFAGTIVTVFLSNDATAVVLTPAVLVIVRRLKVEATPHLLACAFIANAASFVLPISNPANLVIFGNHLPPLGTWLKHFLAPSVASITITFAVLFVFFRNHLHGAMAKDLEPTKLSLNGRLALGSLILAAAVLMTASGLGWSLGAPTFAAALLAAVVVTIRDRGVFLRVARGVSWSVIPLVAGLFILVQALQDAGMFRIALFGLQAASQLSRVTGNLATAFVVGLLSNALNNLPVGLIGGVAVQSPPAHTGMVNAILVGVDLGPNLSVTGSLATILWLIALRREKVKISGWKFLQVGVIVMPLALLGSVLLLR